MSAQFCVKENLRAGSVCPRGEVKDDAGSDATPLEEDTSAWLLECCEYTLEQIKYVNEKIQNGRLSSWNYLKFDKMRTE